MRASRLFSFFAFLSLGAVGGLAETSTAPATPNLIPGAPATDVVTTTGNPSAPVPPALADCSGSFIVAGQIVGLEWTTKRAVESPLRPLESRPIHLILAGKFRRPQWRLVLGTNPLATDPDGGFRIEKDLEPGEASFDLLAVGPKGEVETQSLGFLREQAKPPAPTPPPENNSEPFANRREFSLSLSDESISLTQTSLRDLSVNSLFLGLEASYPLFDNYLELGGSVSASLFNTSNPLPGFNMHFLDAGLYLGRRLALDNFELVPYVQLMYSTMFVTSDAFGYKDGSGEGVGVLGRWFFSRRYLLSAGVGYSFVNTSLSFGNRQIDAHAGIAYRWDPNDQLGFNLGYQSFSLSSSGSAVNRGSAVFQAVYTRAY